MKTGNSVKVISSNQMVAAPVNAAKMRLRLGFLRARLSDLMPAVRQGYLQMFGIPDYERYAAHMIRDHPGDPLLSRRDFFARSIARKYCSSGPRCC